jgi:hypothetical protein
LIIFYLFTFNVHNKNSILKYAAETLIALITVAYFFSVFKVNTSIPDFFYDADSPRTLLYISDPSNAISSIRPLLYLVSWLPHLFIGVLQPQFLWSGLNFICVILIMICIRRIFHATHLSFRNSNLVLTNLSVLCWVTVPDTFILGITFFTIGILLYGDGSKMLNVTLSGIVASSLNVFLFLPWLIAHMLLGRKMLVKSLCRISPATIVVTTIVLFTQYLQKFKPPVMNEDLRASIGGIEAYSNLPLSDRSGALSSVDSLRWFHSPSLGTSRNLLSFFTAPWTQGYSYEQETWAIESELFPFVILLLAILLSFFSFLGIYFIKNENRVFVSFILSSEIATCLLFLTYSTHPYLFAPFLFVSRISGLIFFVRKFEVASIPLTLISAILTLCSLQFMP